MVVHEVYRPSPGYQAAPPAPAGRPALVDADTGHAVTLQDIVRTTKRVIIQPPMLSCLRSKSVKTLDLLLRQGDLQPHLGPGDIFALTFTCRRLVQHSTLTDYANKKLFYAHQLARFIKPNLSPPDLEAFKGRLLHEYVAVPDRETCQDFSCIRDFILHSDRERRNYWPFNGNPGRSLCEYTREDILMTIMRTLHQISRADARDWVARSRTWNWQEAGFVVGSDLVLACHAAGTASLLGGGLAASTAASAASTVALWQTGTVASKAGAVGMGGVTAVSAAATVALPAVALYYLHGSAFAQNNDARERSYTSTYTKDLRLLGVITGRTEDDYLRKQASQQGGLG